MFFLIVVLLPERVKGQMHWSAPVKGCCSFTFLGPSNFYSFIDNDLKTPFSEKAFRNRPISRYTLKRESVFGDSSHQVLNMIDVDYTYDHQGNLISFSYVKPQYVSTEIFRVRYSAKYIYDESGNLTKIDYRHFNTILQEIISFDTNRKTCRFYNSQGTLISFEEQTFEMNGELMETNVYDKTGHLICRYTYGIDKCTGHYCYFHYDEENKLHCIGSLYDRFTRNDILLETGCDDRQVNTPKK